jgi:hypothetical protein
VKAEGEGFNFWRDLVGEVIARKIGLNAMTTEIEQRVDAFGYFSIEFFKVMV